MVQVKNRLVEFLFRHPEYSRANTIHFLMILKDQSVIDIADIFSVNGYKEKREKFEVCWIL